MLSHTNYNAGMGGGMLLIQDAAMALLQNSVGETCTWEGEPWR